MQGAETNQTNLTKNLKVFIGETFPQSSKIDISDSGHSLNDRNIVYSEKDATFYEIRCLQRPGLHFFGQKVLNGSLWCDDRRQLSHDNAA
jgi:hypothetical protein